MARRLVDMHDRRMRLLGEVGHELRSPLSSIFGIAELLNKVELGHMSEKYGGTFDLLLRAAESMKSLVDDLTDYTAIENGCLRLQRNPFSVRDIARERIEIRKASGCRARLVLDAPESATAEIDRARIGQVLDNLLDNAVKYGPPQGEVRVRITEKSGAVQVAVEDQGPGLAPEEQERLFLPFEQGSQAPSCGRHGMGLGLSIARRYVEAHGGTLDVQSTPGQGATFTFVVPCHSSSRQLEEVV